MNKIKLLVFLFLIVPLLIFAHGTAGTSSGSILTYYPDAQIQATGNAGIASLKPNWQHVQLNPAFLTFLQHKSFGFTTSQMYADMKLTNFNMVNEYDELCYFTGIKYYDYGSFTRTTYDDSNLGSFSAKSFILSGYIATPPIKDVYTGIGIKYFNETLAGKTGQALAVDLGGMYVFENYPVGIGVSIQNIGTRIKYASKSEDLPLVIRIGGSYYMLENKVGLFIDLEKIHDQDSNMYFGMEYQISSHFALRGGINSANEIAKGLTLGFDLDILHGLSLNYAYIDNNSFQGTHKITLTYLFDQLKIKEPLKKTGEKIEKAYSYVIDKYEEYKESYEVKKRDERLPQDVSVESQRRHRMGEALSGVEESFNYDSVYYNLAVLNYQRGNYQKALDNIDKITKPDVDSVRLKQMILDRISE